MVDAAVWIQDLFLQHKASNQSNNWLLLPFALSPPLSLSLSFSFYFSRFLSFSMINTATKLDARGGDTWVVPPPLLDECLKALVTSRKPEMNYSRDGGGQSIGPLEFN